MFAEWEGFYLLSKQYIDYIWTWVFNEFDSNKIVWRCLLEEFHFIINYSFSSHCSVIFIYPIPITYQTNSFITIRRSFYSREVYAWYILLKHSFQAIEVVSTFGIFRIWYMSNSCHFLPLFIKYILNFYKACLFSPKTSLS